MNSTDAHKKYVDRLVTLFCYFVSYSILAIIVAAYFIGAERYLKATAMVLSVVLAFFALCGWMAMTTRKMEREGKLE